MPGTVDLIPKYEQLRSGLRDAITKGEYPAHSRLPTQQILMERYQVSFSTVRHALVELQRENLVYSKPGRGVFAADFAEKKAKSKLVFQLFGVHPEGINALPAGWMSGLLDAQHEFDFLMRLSERGTADYMEGRVLSKMERSDGAIFMDLAGTGPIMQAMHATGFPYVVLDVPERRNDVNAVIIDHEAGAYEVVSHLLRLGRRRIACVCLDPDEPNAWAHAKHGGYMRAMREAGIAVRPEWVMRIKGYDSPLHGQHARQALTELLLPRRAELDAVFVTVESMAYGVLDGLIEAGVRVPEDVAVAGFNDEEGCPGRTSPIGLTTIAVPMARATYKAVRLLVAQVRGEEPFPQQKVMQGTLVVRESTAGRQGRVER